jgi:tungstate transport system substrate-binding protein
MNVIRKSFVLPSCLVCWSVILATSLSAVDTRDAVYGDGARAALTVATGSPGELGLLEALATVFNKRHETTIRWKKAGSGKALALLEQKQVDVVLVHAPELEQQAVAEGWASQRTLVGFNEFYIVGPSDDPAEVRAAASVADAYARIARAKATFLSRGDQSGTHKKELAIWKAADIRPTGDWYQTTQDFMLATLQKANARRAYFMTDSSTWVAAREHLPHLERLFHGDPMLVNHYHALCQPQGATPLQPHASRFVKFLSSEKAQTIIRTFGKDRYGEPLYGDARQANAFAGGR